YRTSARAATTRLRSNRRAGWPSFVLHRSPLANFLLLYSALYAAFGVNSPFLPTFLGEHGLAAEQIAAVMAAGTAVRLFSGPLAGRFADRHRAWRALFAGCAGTAAIAALVYVPAHGFWTLIPVAMIQALVLAPLAPIA